MCVSLRKDTTKNIEYKEKNSKFGKLIEKIRNMNIFRILGFKDFLRQSEVLKELINEYTDDFTKAESILFAKNPEMRLWMISTDNNIYFILDNGISLDVVYTTKKGELSFSIQDGEKIAELYLTNTDYKLPIDKNITGGTEKILNILNNYKK